MKRGAGAFFQTWFLRPIVKTIHSNPSNKEWKGWKLGKNGKKEESTVGFGRGKRLGEVKGERIF